jgi:hypothetical protein
MDLGSIIVLLFIVSAFVTFMGILAYGDYATRQALRAREAAAAQAASEPSGHRKVA